ncbi:YLP motif-containing protein 1-like [Heracleum sosnowskyi]|uniref:YLP motif-containing protein 1-like n=1 Tax=Heracleum sosnowskyi TaxID=360622 RepID=A0AAD8LX17_9APIA|nr:YLP motif-containing protein 1-like [Heracleum sosnowskyi]
MLKSRSNPNLGSQMKDEDKHFSTRVLSKESSVANPSFRVYYGDVPSAVPFVWETQPGTPKHNFFPKDDNNPPTLRPPPSFYFTPTRDPTKTNSMSRSKRILFSNLKNIVPPFKKNQLSSSPTSSSSSSSSYSSIATPSNSDQVSVYQRRRLLSVGSAFDDHDIYEFSASKKRSLHNSMLVCFGIHL